MFGALLEHAEITVTGFPTWLSAWRAVCSRIPKQTNMGAGSKTFFSIKKIVNLNVFLTFEVRISHAVAESVFNLNEQQLA